MTYREIIKNSADKMLCQLYDNIIPMGVTDNCIYDSHNIYIFLHKEHDLTFLDYVAKQRFNDAKNILLTDIDIFAFSSNFSKKQALQCSDIAMANHFITNKNFE